MVPLREHRPTRGQHPVRKGSAGVSGTIRADGAPIFPSQNGLEDGVYLRVERLMCSRFRHMIQAVFQKILASSLEGSWCGSMCHLAFVVCLA